MFVKDKLFLSEDNGKADHAFFGRSGGRSRGIYTSLNCSPQSKDRVLHIVRNRDIVADTMGVDHDNLLTVNQVHGSKCLTVTKSWEMDDSPEADAMVTDVSGLAIGVLTADCAPVLFYGETRGGDIPIIGAAHAGWKGALGGVLEATVKSMCDLGATKKSLRASIGPCLGPKFYEVKDNFIKPFVDQDKQNKKFFSPSFHRDYSMFNLPEYVASRLKAAGVKNVSSKSIDTYFNEEDFFSYRAAKHRDDPDYGRQISVIVLL
jgi:YfiH family protein